MFGNNRKPKGPSGQLVEEKLQKLYEAIMVLKSESEEADKKLHGKFKLLEERLAKQISCKHGSREYKFAGGFGPVFYIAKCKDCSLELGMVSMRERLKEELAAAKSEVERLENSLSENFPEDSQ